MERVFKNSILSGITACFLCLGCSQVTMVAEEPASSYYDGRPEISFVSIPAGEYHMTIYRPRNTSTSGIMNAQVERTVQLDAFSMSAREVTNKQYCMFLNEAMKKGENIQVRSVDNDMIAIGSIRDITGSGPLVILKSELSGYRNVFNGSGIRYSKGKFLVIAGHEEYPVVNVTAFGAEAFAEFYGWTLPSEAQWEYAARGGKDHSFGTADGRIDEAGANYDNAIGHTIAVGSYEPNGYGLFDMCGNAAELCISQLRYGSETNTSIGGDGNTVTKGGSWLSYEEGCRIRAKMPQDRYFQYPYSRHEKAPYPQNASLDARVRNNTGFRVVTRVVNR